MKKNRMNFIISFALCGLLAMPVYAGSDTKVKRTANKFLGYADKGVQVAIYSTCILGGAVFVTYMGTLTGVAATATKKNGVQKFAEKIRMQYVRDMSKEPSERAGTIFGGVVFSLVGLSIMGYGIRGLKKMLNEKPQSQQIDQKQDETVDQEPEERIDQIVNSAKRAAGFWSRIWGYSFLTLLGLVGTSTGVVSGVAHLLPKENKLNFRDMKVTNIKDNISRERTGVFFAGPTIGLPLLTLGISGLIRTCKRKNAAKKAEAHEVTI